MRNLVIVPLTPAVPMSRRRAPSLAAVHDEGRDSHAPSTDHSIATPLWTIIKCGLFALGFSGGFMGIVLMAVQGWRPW
jgi:hypothetical protein